MAKKRRHYAMRNGDVEQRGDADKSVTHHRGDGQGFFARIFGGRNKKGNKEETEKIKISIDDDFDSSKIQVIRELSVAIGETYDKIAEIEKQINEQRKNGEVVDPNLRKKKTDLENKLIEMRKDVLVELNRHPSNDIKLSEQLSTGEIIYDTDLNQTDKMFDIIQEKSAAKEAKENFRSPEDKKSKDKSKDSKSSSKDSDQVRMRIYGARSLRDLIQTIKNDLRKTSANTPKNIEVQNLLKEATGLSVREMDRRLRQGDKIGVGYDVNSQKNVDFKITDLDSDVDDERARSIKFRKGQTHT